MGVSTNGQICYGVLFEEGFEFPWDGDIEKWWREMQGYKPPFELYDDAGEYVGGQKPPENKIEDWHSHRREFDKAHPVPVDLVNVCSGDCPIYILAIPEYVYSARRGYPEAFDPTKLLIDPVKEAQLLMFIGDHIGNEHYAPKWYLSSYWG